MRDLTSALATTDCTGPSCPYEADGPDGLCGHCRTVGPREPLSRDALRALMRDDDQPTEGRYRLVPPGTEAPDEQPDVAAAVPMVQPETPRAPIRPRTLPWTREETLDALHAFVRAHGRPPRETECLNANGLPSHVVIRKHFGTMAAMRSILGFPDNPRRTGAAPSPSRSTTTGGTSPSRAPVAATPPDEAPPAGTLVQLAHQVEDKRAQLTEAREQLTAALTALRDAIDTEAV